MRISCLQSRSVLFGICVLTSILEMSQTLHSAVRSGCTQLDCRALSHTICSCVSCSWMWSYVALTSGCVAAVVISQLRNRENLSSMSPRGKLEPHES